MRKVFLAAALGLGVSGCFATPQDMSVSSASTIPGKTVPHPRQEIAAYLEGNWSSQSTSFLEKKGGYGQDSAEILSARIGFFILKSDNKPFYCVEAEIKAKWGFPTRRWWVVRNPIPDMPTAILFTAHFEDRQPVDCMGRSKMEPFPELIAAREVRRAGGNPQSPPAPQAQPVTSHTPVTISAPTDGRAGQ